MDASDEEVWCECSDEEMYNPGKEKKGTWQPKPEDILKLFEELKTKKVRNQLKKVPLTRKATEMLKVMIKKNLIKGVLSGTCSP